MDLLVSAYHWAVLEVSSAHHAHRILTTFAVVVVILRSVSALKRGDGWRGHLV